MTLRAIAIDIEINSTKLLKGISLELTPGKLLGVLGPNGAGKSTLLKALSGDLSPTHGTITLDDIPLQKWQSINLAKRRAVMPQASQLVFPFSAHDVVAMGRWPYEKLCSPFINRLAVEKAMILAGIKHLADRPYPVLSGGEKQRVQLARTLTQSIGLTGDTETKFLLLDEPTAGLDIAHQHAVLAAAKKQCKERGTAGLAILHDLNQAAQYCDSIAIISNGTLISNGPTPEVMEPELLSDIFSCNISRSIDSTSSTPVFLSSI
ncbi:heme ABC transporter ATP-binding protein [Kiloniella sp. EL199]|uniref:heme ABC transporter ATP-binding protein n=1 Tax=Kiloniella sp. EL199 TaxID=2107581 RepID=UPI0013C48D98|nr:heme ABC transporter ATP-binding protein [Kiloniella sp. EL199]